MSSFRALRAFFVLQWMTNARTPDRAPSSRPQTADKRTRCSPPAGPRPGLDPRWSGVAALLSCTAGWRS
ncbi:hypothetical protein AMEX_G13587 [Astyanax mexicanus]|uniref:Secreted protein n=1 Tax=Astyanax mexicanus TaxID=7994 RepID=A0A8T2LL84_ASTMX|nr:hypothetical protein AMEX_G13587 [Astyanax mexicanus]